MRRKLELTDTEREEEERHSALVEICKALNGPDTRPLTEILPGFKPMNELEYYAGLGRLGKIKIALNKGVDLNGRGENDRTALHAAAQHGHLEVVRLLVEQGADVTTRLTSGETPEMLAAVKYPNVAEYLRSIKSAR